MKFGSNVFFQENENLESFISHMRDEIEILKKMGEAKRSGQSYS